MRRTPNAREERFAEYCRLRDAGQRKYDAAREVGIEWYGSGQRYERLYRLERGLPPKAPQPHSSYNPYWAEPRDQA